MDTACFDCLHSILYFADLVPSDSMFEARLLQGSLLKKVIEAIKELVTDANFDCTDSEFGLQAMDSSHVSLVALKLEKDGFEHFRCDKPISMGACFVPDGLDACL